LGPGDSIGMGLAALLCGARCYVALDIVPFAVKADLPTIFQELVWMFSKCEAIPNHQEFPGVRPRLQSYEFPHHLIDCSDLDSRAESIRRELHNGLNKDGLISYRVPWNSPDVIECGSLDLIFSQAALEHIDALEKTYMAMSGWLKPGGYASH